MNIVKISLLFLNENICYELSLEPSWQNGSNKITSAPDKRG